MNDASVNRQIPSPSSRLWTLAVHEAGHCLMAYLLGVGIVRGVIRPHDNTGNVWWRHAAKRYSWLGVDSYGRSVVEADALVALAGAAAQWLYKQWTVRAQELMPDDKTATEILKQLAPEHDVAILWREYLRQRALVMLRPQRCQALIARLAGRFIEQHRLRGEVIEAFLKQEEKSVRPFLIRDGTVEDYVGLIGTEAFAKAIETLPLGMVITRSLRAAGISTVGRLLQYSRYDLGPLGLRGKALKKIEQVVVEAGFELPEHARPNCELVSFDAQFIYEMDRENVERRDRANRQ
jgi:hypothetical protein